MSLITPTIKELVFSTTDSKYYLHISGLDFIIVNRETAAQLLFKYEHWHRREEPLKPTKDLFLIIYSFYE